MQDKTQVEISFFGEEKYCFPAYFEQIHEKILNFEVRNDDVYVISFPKCGTTWTQEMVWLIGNNLDYEGAKKPLTTRFPFLEIEGTFENKEKSIPFGPEINNSIDFAATLPSPRCIKSHLPWSLCPEQIQNKEKTPKIIYTSRNPKDCLVSFFHHVRLFVSYNETFDDFFASFLSGKFLYTPFWSHIIGFWNRRNDDNVLFIQYEDMIKDLPAIIKKTANFLGKSYTEDEIIALAKHLSFDSMKKNPAANNDDLVDRFRKAGIGSSNGKFMRCGKIGDFKNLLSQEQIFQVDKWTEKHINGIDFKIYEV